MPPLEEAVREFYACRRIAVAGVSRDPKQTANAIYKKLKSRGHEVFAINPRAEHVDGNPCYPGLRAIPGGVEAVLVATPASAAIGIVTECRDLGIRWVWLHHGMGPGSASPEAVRFCRENGITVIPGACPMMFGADADIFHRCMRNVMGWFGRLPKVE